MQSGGASVRATGAGDWMGARTREEAARLRGSYSGGSESDRR
jgi:hypothetical protein